MIMEANSESEEEDLTQLFPRNEGRTKTLGINLPASIAAAIKRRGNLKKSISNELLSLIDPTKLAALLKEDAEYQARIKDN